MEENYNYDTNNIFFKITNNIISSDKAYEDTKMIIISDINPVADLHYLAIPKGKYVNYDHFMQNAGNELILHFFKEINNFCCSLGINDNCKIISNNGFGQSVRHYHVHIISGNLKDSQSIPITK